MPSEQAGMSPGLLQRLSYKEPVINVCHQLVFTLFFFVSFSDSTMAALVHFKNTLRLSEKHVPYMFTFKRMYFFSIKRPEVILWQFIRQKFEVFSQK